MNETSIAKTAETGKAADGKSGTSGKEWRHPLFQRKIRPLLDGSVILMSILLVYATSKTVLAGEEMTAGTPMMIQFWICIYFIIVFFVELFMAGPHKKQYFRSHFFFLLVSIPYLNLASYFGNSFDRTLESIAVPFWERLFNSGAESRITFSRDLTAFLKFIPLLRSGYVMAYLVHKLSGSVINSLFFTYITLLTTNLYFCSLLFFEAERSVNAQVSTYWDALWWALMDATTVGSDISAVTTIGKILSVVLAALGMMMFPVFTTYILSLFKSGPKEL